MTEFVPFHENKMPPKSFYSWLLRRRKKQLKGHEDTVIVVVGGEQLGKSRWTLRTEWSLAPSIFYKDGEYDLSNIVFTGNQYRKRLFEITQSILHDDEAATHFYSRQAMTPENVACNKGLMLCGYRHNIQFILLPSFFALDSYIREHRVHAIVKIYPNRKFKAWTFTKSKSKLDLILKNKSFTGVKPRSKGWWSDSETNPEFDLFMVKYRQREAYYKKLASDTTSEELPTTSLSKKDIVKDMVYKLYNSGNITQEQIANAIGLRRETVNKYIASFIRNVTKE